MNHHPSTDDANQHVRPNRIPGPATSIFTSLAAIAVRYFSAVNGSQLVAEAAPSPLAARHLLAAAVIGCFTCVNAAWSQTPESYRRAFKQRLIEPHTGLVEGQGFRLAVQVVARGSNRRSNHVNVWIDRKVNPGTPVYPGSLGPTRFESLCKIAESAGCACYPIENLVLIGRAPWVTELARRIRAQDSSGNRRSVQSDYQWPDLTTPQQALEQIDPRRSDASAETSEDALPRLPHDLWPATKLIDISPGLAKILVVGQFIKVDGSTNSEPDSTASELRFPVLYRSVSASEILSSSKTIDPGSTAGSERGGVVLHATQTAHQFVCRRVFGRRDVAAANTPAAGTAPGGQNGDALERLKTNTRTFSLTVDDVPAGTIIESLVGQIGVRCEMDRANPSLAKIVPIKAKDQTVWQLVRLIASKASLKILAAGDKIRVVAIDD